MTDTIPRGIRPSFPVEVPRSLVRERFQELLGLDEIPTSVDFSTGESHEDDGLRFTSLRYANYLGETISAVLVRPALRQEPDRSRGSSACQEPAARPRR